MAHRSCPDRYSIIYTTEPVTEVIEPSDLSDPSDNNTGSSLDNNPQTDKSKERIMIVEDNDELRFYLKKTFTPTYSVIDKPDGESTLEYRKRNP